MMMERTRFAVCALALGLAPALATAQTLTLPAAAPDSVLVGKSAIVRPFVRDALGRPASVVRVQAWSGDTTVLRVSYVAGGQRLTGVAPGAVSVTWRWQRTDGTSRSLARTVRVVAATQAPPPPPPPTPTPGRLVAVALAPAGELRLAVGDTARLTIAGGAVLQDGRQRPASGAEIAAAAVQWQRSGGYALVAPAADGLSALVTGERAGRTRVDLVVGTSLVSQHWVTVIEAPPSSPAPSAPLAEVPPRPVGVESVDACTRLLVAGELVRLEAGTAYFVRALDGLPAWRYCVADSLAVLLEGDLVVGGDSSAEPPTLLAFAPGTALPVEWPAVLGDTSVRPDSLRIVAVPEAGGSGVNVGGAVVALGLLGAVAAGLAGRGRREGGDA